MCVYFTNMNQQRERIVIRKTRPALSHEQKLVFGLVIAVGGLSLLLGSLYMLRHIASPFFIEYSGELYLSQEQQEALVAQQQQEKDTDEDGLTDYDELYVHGSSPYLRDTDGDGYDDQTEVLAGTDVQCAAGKSCGQEDQLPDAQPFDDLTGDDSLSADDSVESLQGIQQAVGELTVEEIRELLITAGADAEMVNGVSDEDLQALFTEVYGDLQGGEF